MSIFYRTLILLLVLCITQIKFLRWFHGLKNIIIYWQGVFSAVENGIRKDLLS